MKINLKEVNKRIANLKSELASLEEVVKKSKERAPREIPYDVDELVERINNNTLDEELIVGDYLDIELYTGEEIRLIVIGVNHDKMECGAMADYTFRVLFVDMRYKMNDTNTNKTSWIGCKMRNTYLPRIMKLLPKCLQESIVPVKKLTSAGDCNKKIVETTDKLFCFSEIEIYGKNALSYSGEGKQYPYFTEEDHRNIPNYPWLRSPDCNGSNDFCYVANGGSVNYTDASSSNGVAFGFCLSSNNH